jgi:transcriptional regulator of aromatic amino acid metabolism
MGVTATESNSGDTITHGICPECAIEIFGPLTQRVTLMEFLDSLAAPVVVADATGKVNYANKQAQALLHKEASDIEGTNAGDVFECAFAKLPEGCGKTTHCDGCTIRNTVMITFQSGMGHVKLPAQLNQGTQDNYQEAQLVISTEKVNDVVLLRIDRMGCT